MRLGVAGPIAAIAAVGCGDVDVNVPGGVPGDQASLVEGDYAVRVDTGPRELVLSRGDDVLLRFGPDAFQLGALAAVDDETNYDPYRLYVPHPLYVPLDGPTWLDVAAMEIA